MAVEFVDAESGEVLAPDSKGRIVIDGTEMRVRHTRPVNIWPVFVVLALILGFFVGGGVALNMAREDAERAGCVIDPYDVDIERTMQ